MIRSAGFCQVQVRMDEFGLRLTDADDWWRWAWSHGFRQVIEPLTAGQLRVYPETAFRRIGSSGVEGRLQALIATAARRRGG